MDKRILLVEDDSTLSMIVSETLQREGFVVATAANGEDGMEEFARRGADVIVADVMMPRMDGFEMARRIRRGAGLCLRRCRRLCHGSAHWACRAAHAIHSRV